MTTSPNEEQSTGIPVDNQPTEENTTSESQGKQTWVEEIEIAGSQLVERAKELIAEGNVRRLIIRTQDNKAILEIPLTAGVVVGGVVTLAAPLLAALETLAALIAKVKIQIVRAEEPPQA